MADTYTSNLNLTQPEVGASQNSWGSKLNGDMSLLDAVFAAGGTGTSVGLNIGSGKTLSVTGSLLTDTISEKTTDAGVTVDSVLLKDNTVTATTFTGNATSANKWATAITITATGDITGSASIDGTSNESIATTLANSGVAAGSYTASNITVDAKGRVTTASSGSYLPLSGGTMTGDLSLNTVPSERQIIFNMTGRDVYLYGNDSSDVVGLYDSVLAANRWTTDTSGNFTATGNVTAYSDARLKDNVETVTNAVALVEKMRGVRYTRKDTGDAGVGVIAQEMQAVLPEVVLDGEMLAVSYGNIVGVLIEAVKELSARVKELEGK
jgi:hypothetical protein